MDKYDSLKLENQLCFPLYAAARQVVKQYNPYLAELDITYTQYIAMMVFWEHKKISVKDLGSKLFLDSGTLTPVLKSLEQKGYITRNRSKDDERILIAEVTEAGMELREKAVELPQKVAGCVSLDKGEAEVLFNLLNKILKI